jgi:hypothetical protein
MEAIAEPARRRASGPRSTRSFPLWFGILAPPLAWFAHLFLGDLIFELGCAPGMRAKSMFGLSLHTWAVIQTVVLLGVTVGAGAMAFRALRQLRMQSNGASLDRATAMALVGVASSVLYGLILLFGLFPSFFLPQCLPSPLPPP